MNNYPPGVTGTEWQIVGRDDYACEDCEMLLYEEEVVVFKNSTLCISCAEKSINNELDGAVARLERE